MSVRWLRITCEEFEEHLDIMGDHKRVYSSLTDISGTYGTPKVETVWCRDDADGEPLLKGIRWPNADGSGEKPDAAPCEHYFAEHVPALSDPKEEQTK